MSKVVVVCGGRDYGVGGDAAEVFHIVAGQISLLRPTLVIQGGAKGADAHARTFAMTAGIPMLEVPAQWQVYGRAAGPKRNAVMAEVARRLGGDDGWTLLALPGGRGTASMVAEARQRGATIVDKRGGE